MRSSDSEHKNALLRPTAFCVASLCTVLAWGLLFLIFGGWSAFLKRRFTPVYTAITCDMEPPEIHEIDWDNLFTGFSFTLNQTMTCQNPNPYSLTLRSTEGGKVYMGRTMDPVGNITDITDSTLPAHGTGHISLDVKVKPKAELVLKIINANFNLSMPLYVESRMEVIVSINLLLSHFRTQRNFKTLCGFNLRLPNPSGITPTFGPLVCGESFDALALPEANQSAPRGQLNLGDLQLAGSELEAGKRSKNRILGLCSGFGFSFGTLLLLCGVAGLCMQLRRAFWVKAMQEEGVKRQLSEEVPLSKGACGKVREAENVLQNKPRIIGAMFNRVSTE